jgi:hypothetical protein
MQLVQAFEEGRDGILCNLVLDLLCPFRTLAPNTKRAIACGILFFGCFLITLLAFLIAHQSKRASLQIAIISSTISGLSFYVIGWNYQYTARQISDALSVSTLGPQPTKRLISWLKKAVNPWLQLLASVLFILLVLGTLFIVSDGVSFSLESFAKVLTVVLVSFSLGQGAYWAIVSPLFAKELSTGDEAYFLDLKVDSLYPTRTPILLAASRLLSVAALSDALMVTLCLISLFVLKPSFGETILYPLLILLAGYLLTLWNFAYPQLNLSRIIQWAKRRTLDKIRSEASKLYQRLDELTPSEFERLDQLMNLHESVTRSPNTMVNLQAFRSLLGSLLTPAIVGIIGVIDWRGVLHNLPIGH